MVTKPVENVAVSVLCKLQTIAVDDPEFHLSLRVLGVARNPW